MKNSDKIKICIVVSSLSNTGPVNAIYSICNKIDKTQFDIAIVALFKEQEKSLINDIIQTDVNVHLQKHNKYNFISSFIETKKLIKNINPDIIHSHCLLSMLFISFSRFRIKLHTIQVVPKEQYLLKYGFIKGLLMIYLSYFFYKKMDLLISCAFHVNAKINKIKKVNTIPIPNAIDINKYILSKDVSIKTKYNLQNKLVYIMNNRHSKEKNNQFIIENFPDDEQKYLIVIGDGPLFIKNKSVAKSNVEFIPYTNMVEDVLKRGDYYISASKVEGLPFALLEALSCGLKPIVSNIDAHLEIVKYLESPIIFNTNNKNELKNIFSKNKIVTDFEKQNIRQQIINNFSDINMIKKHEELYKYLLNNK